jgi:signal transduction histidine kinase
VSWPRSLRFPLSRWISVRILALAIGTAVVVATCMWLRFAIWNATVMRRMPEAERTELKYLVAHPDRDNYRLLQLINQYYGVDYVYPEIGNEDWLTLGVLLACATPAIMALAWRMSRPVSRQFLQVADAARQVARGDFSARAPLLPHVPQEFTELALDFNEMTARLQDYEREVRDSGAILAHELRTPLNAAMGRLQGMIDGVFPADQEQLQTVMRRLALLNRLVDDLHLLSLARAGQLVVERIRFNLADLIEERLSWMAGRIESGAIRVTREIDPALTVEADRERLGKVFSILIDNALRYAADGGELAIRVTLEGEQRLLIEFADRGPGFTPEALPRTLDRFWRAESARSRHTAGSGLGLSIASAIAAAHGGLLAVMNRDGGGAMIRITLLVGISTGTE